MPENYTPQLTIDAAASLAASRDFFTSTYSYTTFDYTRPDYRFILDCIEPRNQLRQDGKKVKTAAQTAGAGAGEGHDRALAETALGGELVKVEDALAQEIEERGNVVLGSHWRCAFIGGMLLVLAEESSPGDFTRYNYERTFQRYGIAEQMKPVMPKIQDAAKRQLDHAVQNGFAEDLAEVIDRSYPNHANVHPVIGENVARIWVENHHPHIGLNREKKARKRQEEGLDIQGYHENRRAVYDLINSYDLKRRERLYRIGAFASRNAAARTVLTHKYPDTEFYEVSLGKSGITIMQQEGWR
jgi:hypothetical protein